MRKELLIAMTSSAILLLTGCGATVTEQPAPQQSETVTANVRQTQPETTAPITEAPTSRPSTTRAASTTKQTTVRQTTAAPTTVLHTTAKNTTAKPATTTKATTYATTQATTTKSTTTATTVAPLPKTVAPISYAPDKISDYPAYMDVLKTNRSILFDKEETNIADYALCDLDADGTPELWIVNAPYWTEDHTRLYTLSGNKAVLVRAATGRSWFMPTKTGFIHAWGSGGAAYHVEEFYIYRGGTKMELVNEYSYEVRDDKEYFKENNTALTESEYRKATSQYGEDIKLNTASVSKVVSSPSAEAKKTHFSGRGTPNSSDGYANLRSSMDYSDNVVFPVYNGTLMAVESTDDPEWYWVNPDNSGYGGGYMKASLVELFADLKNVKKPSNMTYLGRGTSTSADGFLNVHADPSISKGNTVDTLPNGAYGDVYSYGDKSWYYIKTATGYGYVKSSFIKMLKKGEYEDIVYNSEFGYVENWDKPKSNMAAVQSCDLRGEVNTHGKGIASFMTSYVVNNGKKAMVFERLDNGTTVKAVNYYRSYDVDWYELYAVSDGTYLGWVDVNYIDFYE